MTVKRMNFISNILYLAYPDLCLICDSPLIEQERLLCHNCIYKLPAINHSSFTDNEVTSLFYGKIPCSKGAAGFSYSKESVIQDLFERMKYKNLKEIGYILGAFIGNKLHRKGFFNEIDWLVPVPLHPKKYRKRGYNQSEYIANGLASCCHLPVDTKSLIRCFDNQTQTKQALFERWENVAGLFELKQASHLKDKHILLVDDVLTSGSTLEACGQTLLQIPGMKLSFFTLAKA